MSGEQESFRRYGGWRRVFNGWAQPARRILAALGLMLAGLGGASAAADDDEIVIVALGDSLAAGFGLAPEDAFPQQLQDALAADGVAARVINAGVSGDTTAGGRARLDWSVGEAVDLVIVELGANDGLRGIDPETTRANLDDIIARLADRGIAVMVAGMLAPPNLGRDYGAAFNSIFPALAVKHDAVLYPFFLDGVAAQPSLNQGDGIHPNRDGVAVIVERMTPFVIDALVRQGAVRSGAVRDATGDG